MKMGHVQQIECQLDDLEGSIAQLARDDFVQALRKAAHGPGWTSVAESHLVSGALDALRFHVSALSTQSRQLVSAAEEIGNGESVTRDSGVQSDGAILRQLFPMLVEASGSADKAAFFKKSVEELRSKSLLNEQEAQQFRAIIDIACSDDASKDSPRRIRLACQEMSAPGHSALAISMAEAVSHAMLAIDDAFHEGFSDETKKVDPQQVLASTLAGAVGGAVVGAAVGGGIGAVVGAVAGAIAGFFSNLV
jgi:hypothetical protein